MTVRENFSHDKKITIYREFKVSMEVELEEHLNKVKEHLGLDSEAEVFKYLVRDYFSKEIVKDRGI
jgi:hypothetical protein